MAPPVLVPDKTTLRRWKREGLTQQEMVDRHFAETGIQVSRASIAAAMVRYGLAGTKPRYYGTIPWHVKGEHLTHYAVRMLRLLGRRKAGGDLNNLEALRLDSWLEMLDREHAVVGYDPDSEDGFYYIDAKYRDSKDAPIRTKRIHAA